MFSKSGFRLKILLYLISISPLILGGCRNVYPDPVATQLERIDSVFLKASQLIDSGHMYAGLKLIDSAEAEMGKGVRQKFRFLAFRSGTYYRINDIRQAQIFIDSMMDLIVSEGPEKYKEEYAKANFAKGDILIKFNRFHEAYRHYYIAWMVGRKTLDLCTQAQYSYRMAMLLFNQYRYLEAAENFKMAFNQSQHCNNDFPNYFFRQEILSNISLSYEKINELDSSLLYSNRALNYIAANEYKYPEKRSWHEMAKGVAYGDQGRVFIKRGAYDTAEVLLEKAVAINSRKGYENRDAQGCQLLLAEISYLHNDLEKMGEILQQSRLSLDTVANDVAEKEWNRLMWKYNARKNDISEAYQYLLKYTVIADSLNILKNEYLSTNVSQQIKILENDSKIEQLNKENQFKNLYIAVSVAGLLLTAAIGFLIYLNSKNARRNVERLKVLNNRIEEQNIALEAALEKLKKREKEKDRILRVVAHDLRTPAASISTITDLLMDEHEEVTRKEMLSLIKGATENSLHLINEILEAAGKESNGYLIKERFSVNELLKSVTELMRFEAAQKQQHLELQLLEKDLKVLVDRDKIARVISNLITNAIKFSKPGGKIIIGAHQSGNTVEMWVRDFGIGIPEHFKPKIFDIFTEAKRSGTSGEKPHGLGLSICRQIVESFGGKIWFVSEEGVGSTFFVSFECS